jgi:hypothetical protein
MKRVHRLVFLGLVTFECAACSSSDEKAATLPADCDPIEATHYDAERNCIATETLDGLCFSVDGEKANSGEQAILIGPDAVCYYTTKDFNACLTGPGWVTPESGVSHGWSVFEAMPAHCAHDSSEIPDGTCATPAKSTPGCE